MKTKMRKALSVILSLMMIFSVLSVCAVSAFAEDIVYTLGDVDGNGKINAADARSILRHSAKLDVFTKAQVEVADINADGKINSADARIALRISAKLESINDYIPEEPEDPTPDPEPAPDTVEISGYLLGTPDDVADGTGLEFVYDDEWGMYTSDAFSYAAYGYDWDEDGECEEEIVEMIVLSNANEYTIYGVSVGMSAEEAKAALTEGGYEVYESAYGELRVIDYESSIDLSVYFEGDEVSEVYLSYAYMGIEFYLAMNSEYIVNDYPDLEKVDEHTYANDYFTVGISDYGYITALSCIKESAVSIYDLSVGDSTELLADWAEYFGFEETADGVYEYPYYEEVVMISSDNGVITEISIMRGAYSELSMYVAAEENFILSDFPELELNEDRELAEDEKCYTMDGVSFVIAFDGYVREVAVTSESIFSVLDVQCGMSVDEAIELLSMYGYDVEVNECYWLDNEYLLLESADGETVSGVTYGFFYEE